MTRHFSAVNLASTLSLLALSACDESTTLTQPTERASQLAAAAASYSARDLNVPSMGEGGSTTAINAAGLIVGYTFGPDDTFRGFIWRSGVSTHLGTLGGRQTLAFDINDDGLVVGSSENQFGNMRAFRWKNGTMTGLGSLGGRVSRAFGINHTGHIVGQSQITGNLASHAFLFKNGQMTDLGTLGGANSAALDINDAEQIVGWSETASGVRHPFLWENGTMKDLLPPASASTGTAYAISPSAVVVGERNNSAFWYSGGVLKNLALGSTGPSVATGIRAGRIVGTLNTPTGQRGFVWSGGQVTRLPLLHPGMDDEDEDNGATAINAAGVIVGTTKTFDSNVHPTRWIPQ